MREPPSPPLHLSALVPFLLREMKKNPSIAPSVAHLLPALHPPCLARALAWTAFPPPTPSLQPLVDTHAQQTPRMGSFVRSFVRRPSVESCSRRRSAGWARGSLACLVHAVVRRVMSVTRRPPSARRAAAGWAGPTGRVRHPGGVGRTPFDGRAPPPCVRSLSPRAASQPASPAPPAPSDPDRPNPTIASVSSRPRDPPNPQPPLRSGSFPRLGPSRVGLKGLQAAAAAAVVA